MALNDGEVDMQIENEEASQNPLSLAQLLDKDEILEGDINVEMAEEANTKFPNPCILHQVATTFLFKN